MAATEVTERTVAKAAKAAKRGANTVDGIPPLARLFPLGLQHVLAMYAGAVAVPLIVGGALGYSAEDLAFLISADLFVAGIATIIQSVGFWRFGVRLPLMQGVTFAGSRRRRCSACRCFSASCWARSRRCRPPAGRGHGAHPDAGALGRAGRRAGRRRDAGRRVVDPGRRPRARPEEHVT